MGWSSIEYIAKTNCLGHFSTQISNYLQMEISLYGKNANICGQSYTTSFHLVNVFGVLDDD